MEECPELVKKLAGDEAFYYCKLMETMCWKEYLNEPCEEYDSFLKEGL